MANNEVISNYSEQELLQETAQMTTTRVEEVKKQVVSELEKDNVKNVQRLKYWAKALSEDRLSDPTIQIIKGLLPKFPPLGVDEQQASKRLSTHCTRDQIFICTL